MNDPVLDDAVPDDAVPDDAVTYGLEGPVAHLRLNRPQSHNAVDPALAAGLVAALERADSDPAVHAVVLSGAGPSFCVGGDLRSMGGAGDPSTFVGDLATASNRATELMVGLSKPLVVAVHGNVAGAGLGYACAGDVVLAAEGTRFTSAFTAVGLSPDSGVSWLLPRVVGARRAAELVLTNRRLDARTALDWGLVTSVHPDDEVLDAALDLAGTLASRAPAAPGRTRRLLADTWDRTLAEQLAEEAGTIRHLAGTPQTQALITAFLDRG